MNDMHLAILVRGDDAASAANEMEAVLSEGADVGISRSTPEVLPEELRRAIDPIALAALVISVPAAVVAAMDLADRLRKRKKAKEVIETASRLRLERKVEVTVLTLEGGKPLEHLDPDQLLEIAEQSGKSDQ